MTHFCVAGGHVVGADAWIPTPAWDYHWGAVTPAIGCNHLVCGDCAEPVRQRAGVEVEPNETLEPDDLRGKAEAAWDQLSQVVASNVGRIYACGCAVRTLFADRELVPSDGDDLHSVGTAWRCAGHPSLELPATLDGVQLAADGGDDWGDIVTRSLSGALPQPAQRPWIGLSDKRHPAFWLARLPMLVDDLGVARAVATHAASGLDSDDVLVRRGAINFYRYHPNALGADRLAQLMEARPELYRGVPDPDRPRRDLARYANEVLDTRLSLRDAAGDPLAPEAVAYARSEVSQGRARMGHIFRLALLDADWLAAQVATILETQPQLAKSLVMALADGAEATFMHGVGELAKVTSLSADELVAVVEANVPNPQRRSKALAVLRG